MANTDIDSGGLSENLRPEGRLKSLFKRVGRSVAEARSTLEDAARSAFGNDTKKGLKEAAELVRLVRGPNADVNETARIGTGDGKNIEPGTVNDPDTLRRGMNRLNSPAYVIRSIEEAVAKEALLLKAYELDHERLDERYASMRQADQPNTAIPLSTETGVPRLSSQQTVARLVEVSPKKSAANFPPRTSSRHPVSPSAYNVRPEAGIGNERVFLSRSSSLSSSQTDLSGDTLVTNKPVNFSRPLTPEAQTKALDARTRSRSASVAD